MVNVVRRLRDLFSFRHLIHGFLVIEVFFIISQDFFDLTYFFSDWSSISKYEVTNHFIEANNFIDWSKLLQRTDHLRALGGLLYTQYKITLLIAAILLFLSRVGALVLTLSIDSTNKNTLIINSINNSNNSQTIKRQDANHQVRRQPNLLFY